MAVTDGLTDLNIKDELERKACESMEQAIRHVQTGRISRDFYMGMMLGINSTTSGLIDKSLTAALDSELAFRSETPSAFSALLYSGHKLILIGYVHGNEEARLMTFDCRDVIAKQSTVPLTGPDNNDPVERVWEATKRLVVALERKGYVRLA